MGFLSITYIATFMVYLSNPNGKYDVLNLVAPTSWAFIKASLNPHITDTQMIEGINLYRNSISLPPDRDWLD